MEIQIEKNMVKSNGNLVYVGAYRDYVGFPKLGAPCWGPDRKDHIKFEWTHDGALGLSALVLSVRWFRV